MPLPVSLWEPFSFKPSQSENTVFNVPAMEGLGYSVTSELTVPQCQLESFPGVVSRVTEVRWPTIFSEDNG